MKRKVYIVVWNTSTHEGTQWDILNVYFDEKEAQNHIACDYVDFIHGVERGDFGVDFTSKNLLESKDNHPNYLNIEDTETGYFSEWYIECFEVEEPKSESAKENPTANNTTLGEAIEAYKKLRTQKDGAKFSVKK